MDILCKRPANFVPATCIVQLLSLFCLIDRDRLWRLDGDDHLNSEVGTVWAEQSICFKLVKVRETEGTDMGFGLPFRPVDRVQLSLFGMDQFLLS